MSRNSQSESGCSGLSCIDDDDYDDDIQIILPVTSPPTESLDKSSSPDSAKIDQLIKNFLIKSDIVKTLDLNCRVLQESFQHLEKELEKIHLSFQVVKNISEKYPIPETHVQGIGTINPTDGSLTVFSPFARVVALSNIKRAVEKTLDNSEDQVNLGILPQISLIDDPDIEICQLWREESKKLKPVLPPRGEFKRPPLKVGHEVLACKNVLDYQYHPWLPAKIKEIRGMSKYTLSYKDPFAPDTFMIGRKIAYRRKLDVLLNLSERVVACLSHGPNKGSFYSGFVAEPPKPANNYRYLIFFDNGVAGYSSIDDVFPVVDVGFFPLEEAPNELKHFLKKYYKDYPEITMVKFQERARIRVRVEQEWVTGRVIKLDCSMVKFFYKKTGLSEWVYRGSPRLYPLSNEMLQKSIEERKSRPVKKITDQRFVSFNEKVRRPFVQYFCDDELEEEEEKEKLVAAQGKETAEQQKKDIQTVSTIFTKWVNLIPDILPKFKTNLYVPHRCDQMCVRANEAEYFTYRDYNPFSMPIILGWSREVIWFRGLRNRRQQYICYVAPCGRRLRSIQEVDHYLLIVHSKLSIDLFSFHSKLSLYSLLDKSSKDQGCFYFEPDIARGTENHSVSVINPVNDRTLPVDFEYAATRFAADGVFVETDPHFLLCCNCPDNCRDKTKCECQRQSFEISRCYNFNLRPEDSGYSYRRLLTDVMTGLWECNSNCSCDKNCSNRVVQNGMVAKLQIFYTGPKKGWGIRPLHDIPPGTFLCIYAAQILNFNEEDDNLRSDEYYADLDYIEALENRLREKEGFEEAPTETISSDDESSRISSEDETYQGFYCPAEKTRTSHRIQAKKSRKETKEEQTLKKTQEQKHEQEKKCRKEFRSIRSFYGESQAYTLDAKFKGNIGRFINHSCAPNCFVQNVFIDSHDLRFPWVAFFSKVFIPAFTELTWDYGYTVDSVAGRKIKCFCGSKNCRGRLL